MSNVVQNLLDAISSGALYALAALGLGLVFGMMRLANFAHGELITACGYTLVLTWPYGVVPALVLTVVVGIALAVLCELVVFRKLRGAHPATLLIASFGLSFFLQRVYAIVFGNNVRTGGVASGLARSVSFLGIDARMLSMVTIALAVALMFGLRVFLDKTSWGLQVQAASADFGTARLLGVRANRVISLTFALSGVLAAAVAFVLATQTGAVGPSFGVNITILALIGAVIGGIDKLSGALVGGFIIGFCASLLSAWLPQSSVNFRDAFVFVIVLLVLLVRPGGLLTPAAVERA
ncbi:branched-chain amino acid ABC transporter permease [Flexivirga sp.]|uniref:branched-chain amino acid ABC transporter permease n=1 Tax=Flexivirga sp. TaxID=1962927 RepID=UPI003F7F494B